VAELAAIILAHTNPGQVRRLITALPGLDVFLHCDQRTPADVLEQMTAGVSAPVHIVERRRTTLASWSLVEAELSGLRAALGHSSAEHLIVLSGTCYPLVSMAELHEELAAWRGLTRMQLTPVPFSWWSTPRNPDGGMWRFRRRFLSIREQQLFVRQVPLRTFKRRIPGELHLTASAQWKIYARAHVETVLAVLDQRPDLVRFWRTTFIPDESALASILASPELVGSVTEELRNDLPWWMDWSTGTGHPRWLDVEDFPTLESARWAPPGDPDAMPDWGAWGAGDAHRKLFARKLKPDLRLQDLIDERLRL